MTNLYQFLTIKVFESLSFDFSKYIIANLKKNSNDFGERETRCLSDLCFLTRWPRHDLGLAMSLSAPAFFTYK